MNKLMFCCVLLATLANTKWWGCLCNSGANDNATLDVNVMLKNKTNTVYILSRDEIMMMQLKHRLGLVSQCCVGLLTSEAEM